MKELGKPKSRNWCFCKLTSKRSFKFNQTFVVQVDMSPKPSFETPTLVSRYFRPKVDLKTPHLTHIAAAHLESSVLEKHLPQKKTKMSFRFPNCHNICCKYVQQSNNQLLNSKNFTANCWINHEILLFLETISETVVVEIRYQLNI